MSIVKKIFGRWNFSIGHKFSYNRCGHKHYTVSLCWYIRVKGCRERDTGTNERQNYTFILSI